MNWPKHNVKLVNTDTQKTIEEKQLTAPELIAFNLELKDKNSPLRWVPNK